MPVLTPYAAQEIAMVSSTPGGRGLPIGLMPGALPSDQASRQTLKTTAMRFLSGHCQFEFFMVRNPSARYFKSQIRIAAGGSSALPDPRHSLPVGAERGCSGALRTHPLHCTVAAPALISL